MHGIYGLIDIGISTLRTAQTALMATGDNISNAENPNFTRREVVFQEKPPIVSLPILIGRGAEVVKIKRVYDTFLAKQWQQEQAGMGYYEVKKEGMDRVETIFNDLQGGGISDNLTAFWNAWEEVASDPTSSVARQNLLYKTNTLINNFHKMSDDLKGLQTDMDTEIANAVTQINTISQQIAYLNQQIKSIEVRNVDANNFRDERDKLIRQLSELGDVTTFETENGITVLLGGMPLVEGNKAYSLETETNATGHYQINWLGENNLKVNITNRITNGKVGAYLELRDTIIPNYLNEVDKLAYNLVEEINSQHQLGYGLDGNTGYNFFDPLASITDAAQNINLSSDVSDSPDHIAAASSWSTGGEPGNNQNALAILGLKDSPIAGLNNSTFGDFYHSLIGLVGTKTQETNLNYDHQKMVLKEVKDRFDTVSGVSVDEEAANLVKYQQMYNASAKLISVADEMFKTLINLGT